MGGSIRELAKGSLASSMAFNAWSVGRVLVMDDERVVRDVLGDMLKHMGYTVTFAADGGEAVKLYRTAKEAGKAFDAVILDLTIQGAGRSLPEAVDTSG